MKIEFAKLILLAALAVLLVGLWWAGGRQPSPTGSPLPSVGGTPVRQRVAPHALAESHAATNVGLSNHTAPVGPPPAKPRAVEASPEPPWVDLLLTNGAAMIAYDQAVAHPLGKASIDRLIRRYNELPLLPFTNRFGIARALAYVGDERVVNLFRRTLFSDCQGLRFPRQEEMPVHGLVVMMGDLAARYDAALDVLRSGLDERYWQTNVSWTIEGVSPASLLVEDTIRALALTGRTEAWNLVLEKRRSADQEYLRRHAGAMVDAAAWWASVRDHGRAYLAASRGRAQFDLFVRWAETPEGEAWRAWARQVDDQTSVHSP